MPLCLQVITSTKIQREKGRKGLMDRFRIYAGAIIDNGRPFAESNGLGRWIGFRWGKAQVSVRMDTPKRIRDLLEWDPDYRPTLIWPTGKQEINDNLLLLEITGKSLLASLEGMK
jgi:hypothetical protein